MRRPLFTHQNRYVRLQSVCVSPGHKSVCKKRICTKYQRDIEIKPNGTGNRSRGSTFFKMKKKKNVSSSPASPSSSSSSSFAMPLKNKQDNNRWEIIWVGGCWATRHPSIHPPSSSQRQAQTPPTDRPTAQHTTSSFNSRVILLTTTQSLPPPPLPPC